MGESLITPEAMAMIGQETGTSVGTVYKKEFQRWAASVNDLNPLYFDEEYAKANGYKDVVMPPLFLTCVASGVNRLDIMRRDGTPGGGGRNDIPLKVERRMAGGNTTEYLAPIYPGDVITAVTRLKNLEDKNGRQGPFVLVSNETIYTNQDGVVVARGNGSSIVK